jgi:purine-nucleoside phosphorylase
MPSKQKSSSRIAARAVARILDESCPLRPTLAFVLGSGLQSVVDEVQVHTTISYDDLPGFPRPTVRGHAGLLFFGHIAKTPILLLSGRAHYYEGCSMSQVTFPIRVLAEYGIRDLVLTNAAGAISPRLRPGDLMLVADHINFLPENPLRGEPPSGLPRFVDLTQVYDPGLARLLAEAAKSAKIRLRSGVYLAVSGPCYETPAEIRAFARLGADAVGMSTVPEAIVARQHGLSVAAISCMTNFASGRAKAPLSHAEVLDTARRIQPQLAAIFRRFTALYASKT